MFKKEVIIMLGVPLLIIVLDVLAAILVPEIIE